MASSPAPATPDRGPRRWPTMNRSVTLPPSLATSSKSPATGDNGTTDAVETLYFHPNVTVVKFTTATTSARPSPVGSSPKRPGSSAGGLLPWASARESTMAAGPLEIYRVRGSVSFLRSGSLLHAIMPRSQCWCVDGVSKFVMRVLADTYYRIELPGVTEEDMQKVEEMKATLHKVLFYERSVCPFSRTFSLDLPEMPDVKSRRGGGAGPAKKWKLDHAFSWKPEDGERSRRRSSSGEDELSDPSSPVDSDDESQLVDTPSKSRAPGASAADELIDKVDSLAVGALPVPKSAAGLRSFTAPPLLLAEEGARTFETGIVVDEAVGAIESAEATRRAQMEDEARTATPSANRTFQPIPTQMPPSPPDSSAGLDAPDIRSEIPQEAIPRDVETVVQESTTHPTPAAADTTGDSTPEPRPENLSATEIHLSEETKEYMREIVRQHDDDTQILEQAEAQDCSYTVGADIDPSTMQSTSASIETPELPDPTVEPIEDPYAAIQARIQARRSIGGTTSFHLANNTLSRSSTSSASSSGTITSNRSNISLASSRQQQALATALVRKACSVFLGPPAHLVAVMLRIAARFANATFGVDSMFYVATSTGSSRRIPGSFHPSGGISSDEDDDDEEDDFGVPIRNPIPLAYREMSDAQVATMNGLRERRKR